MNEHPASSVVETIGQTPLVELTRLVNQEGVDGVILAKLDYLNPGSSKRTASPGRDRDLIGDRDGSSADRLARAVSPVGGGALLRRAVHRWSSAGGASVPGQTIPTIPLQIVGIV